MNPKVSVITPASRGVETLSYLLNDFKNQTVVKMMEHIVVYDGPPSDDVKALMKSYEKLYNLRFTWIPKDTGNMKQSPGTNPRNHGISSAKGDFVCFFDDDDRAKSTYVESLLSGMQDENSVSVVQMSCQESRMIRNGNPERIVLVPEIGLPSFPIICHVGTPCFMVKREWAIAEPWRHEPEHDFRFIKRICDRFKPTIRMTGGMQIDVDGLVIRGLRDFVSFPPYYREF